MRYFVVLIVALILNASANLLIKAAASRLAASGDVLAGGVVPAVKAVASSGLFMLGLICFALNLLAYLYALQKLQISLAYPIMVTCGYAIIVVIASWKMGESLVPVQWVGIGLMLLGVWLVGSGVNGRKPADGAMPPAPAVPQQVSQADAGQISSGQR